MEMTIKKMPDGEFGVDASTMEIVKEDKAPWRPIIKVKEQTPPEPEIVPAANQAASTASDVAGIVADFNALLVKLKASGAMKADTQ